MKSRINDRLSLNFITLELASCIFESFIKEWENYQNRYFFKVFKIHNNFRCFCLFVLLKCSYFILKAKILALASVAQLLGTSSHTLKGCRFNFHQGTCLGCGFIRWSGRLGGEKPVNILLLHQYFFLSVSLPPPPCFLSKSMKKCPWVRIKRKL